MQNFTAVLIKNDDGTWTAFAEEVVGANTQGNTQEEALENLADAVKMILDYRKECLYRDLPSKNFETRTCSFA